MNRAAELWAHARTHTAPPLRVALQVPDVRAVVKSYDGQDIPAAFRDRMKRVQDQQSQRTSKPKGFLSGRARK